jgi:hypothetical protein
MRFWALTFVASSVLGQTSATAVKRESNSYDFVSRRGLGFQQP